MRFVTFFGLPALAGVLLLSGCQRSDAPDPHHAPATPQLTAPTSSTNTQDVKNAAESTQSLPDDQSDDMSSMGSDKNAKTPSTEASTQSGTLEGGE